MLMVLLQRSSTHACHNMRRTHARMLLPVLPARKQCYDAANLSLWSPAAGMYQHAVNGIWLSAASVMSRNDHIS
jgi:hypothetical protein